MSSSDGKPGTEKNHYSDPDVTFDLTDVGVDFIKENRHGPFFLQFSHWDVHGPLDARRHLIAKYEEKLVAWTRN